MTYAYVQKVLDSAGGGGFSGSGSNVATASWTNTLGNFIIMAVMYQGALTTATMADTKGNAYTQIGTGTHDANNMSSHWFYAWNCAAGANVITASFGASVAFRSLIGEEYSGIRNSSDPLAGFNLGPPQNAPGSGTDAITSGNGTPTGQPALAWGAVTNGGNGNAVTSAGTGYGNLITQNCTNLSRSFATEDSRITATTAIAATFTDSGGGSTYSTVVAFFLEPSTPPSAPLAWIRGI